jgi:hypothetical protein
VAPQRRGECGGDNAIFCRSCPGRRFVAASNWIVDGQKCDPTRGACTRHAVAADYLTPAVCWSASAASRASTETDADVAEPWALLTPGRVGGDQSALLEHASAPGLACQLVTTRDTVQHSKSCCSRRWSAVAPVFGQSSWQVGPSDLRRRWRSPLRPADQSSGRTAKPPLAFFVPGHPGPGMPLTGCDNRCLVTS